MGLHLLAGGNSALWFSRMTLRSSHQNWSILINPESVKKAMLLIASLAEVLPGTPTPHTLSCRHDVSDSIRRHTGCRPAPKRKSSNLQFVFGWNTRDPSQ